MKIEPGPLQKIAPTVKFGEGVKVYDFVNLYGCEIDDNSKIGTFVEIQKGAKIGKNCKISSHTFICEGVTIEDDVFVGCWSRCQAHDAKQFGTHDHIVIQFKPCGLEQPQANIT